MRGGRETGVFSSTILNGGAVRTKVNGRYREGGHLSEVAVMRGSTILLSRVIVLYVMFSTEGLIIMVSHL